MRVVVEAKKECYEDLTWVRVLEFNYDSKRGRVSLKFDYGESFEIEILYDHNIKVFDI